jgi:hypothetical protein
MSPKPTHQQQQSSPPANQGPNNLNAGISTAEHCRDQTNPEINPPTTGTIKLNNIRCKYMCDEDAAKTVMTRKLFDMIEKDNSSSITIEQYEGSEVYSVTGPLQITGLATVQKVKINNETTLDNVSILVAN